MADVSVHVVHEISITLVILLAPVMVALVVLATKYPDERIYVCMCIPLRLTKWLFMLPVGFLIAKLSAQCTLVRGSL